MNLCNSEIGLMLQIGSVLWKTVEDMWDMEPDGRITSGCAYERANTLYMSYAVDGPAENAQPRSSHPLSELFNWHLRYVC